MQDIISLEKLDESLLRFLLDSHSKTPLEMLHLESGATPICYVVSSRRLNYFHTIMKREDEELTKRILKAQIDHPSPGDFIKLVEDDFLKIGVQMDLCFVQNSRKDVFKSFVKNKIRTAALKYLQNLQQTHTKVKHIKYEKLEVQKYLTSPLFSNEETKLLFALRTRTVEGVKSNFQNMYSGNLFCPLQCWGQGEPPISDTQQHLLTCTKLQTRISTEDISCDNVLYIHLFSEVGKQKEATVLFSRLINAREQMESDNPPGDLLDPSTGTSLGCDSVFLLDLH